MNVSQDSTTVQVDPRHLTLLRVFLTVEGYCQHAIEAVLEYVTAEGTIEGCDALDPEDYETAEGWLEAGYPTEPWTSPAWDEDSWSDHGPTYWTTGEGLLMDVQEHIHQATMGGGPEEEPYQPSKAELAELAEWSAGGMAFPIAEELSPLERHHRALEDARIFGRK